MQRGMPFRSDGTIITKIHQKEYFLVRICSWPGTKNSLPSYLLAGVTATAIALGDAHTCVIVTGGGVKCWGKNENGQLGIGNTVQKISPVDVSLGAGVYNIFLSNTSRGLASPKLCATGTTQGPDHFIIVVGNENA